MKVNNLKILAPAAAFTTLFLVGCSETRKLVQLRMKLV